MALPNFCNLAWHKVACVGVRLVQGQDTCPVCTEPIRTNLPIDLDSRLDLPLRSEDGEENVVRLQTPPENQVADVRSLALGLSQHVQVMRACGHTFHERCIAHWVKVAPGTVACPSCNVAVAAEDVAEMRNGTFEIQDGERQEQTALIQRMYDYRLRRLREQPYLDQLRDDAARRAQSEIRANEAQEEERRFARARAQRRWAAVKAEQERVLRDRVEQLSIDERKKEQSAGRAEAERRIQNVLAEVARLQQEARDEAARAEAIQRERDTQSVADLRKVPGDTFTLVTGDTILPAKITTQELRMDYLFTKLLWAVANWPPPDSTTPERDNDKNAFKFLQELAQAGLPPERQDRRGYNAMMVAAELLKFRWVARFVAGGVENPFRMNVLWRSGTKRSRNRKNAFEIAEAVPVTDADDPMLKESVVRLLKGATEAAKSTSSATSTDAEQPGSQQTLLSKLVTDAKLNAVYSLDAILHILLSEPAETLRATEPSELGLWLVATLIDDLEIIIRDKQNTLPVAAQEVWHEATKGAISKYKQLAKRWRKEFTAMTVTMRDLVRRVVLPLIDDLIDLGPQIWNYFKPDGAEQLNILRKITSQAKPAIEHAFSYQEFATLRNKESALMTMYLESFTQYQTMTPATQDDELLGRIMQSVRSVPVQKWTIRPSDDEEKQLRQNSQTAARKTAAMRAFVSYKRSRASVQPVHPFDAVAEHFLGVATGAAGRPTAASIKDYFTEHLFGIIRSYKEANPILGKFFDERQRSLITDLNEFSKHLDARLENIEVVDFRPLGNSKPPAVWTQPAFGDDEWKWLHTAFYFSVLMLFFTAVAKHAHENPGEQTGVVMMRIIVNVLYRGFIEPNAPTLTKKQILDKVFLYPGIDFGRLSAEAPFSRAWVVWYPVKGNEIDVDNPVARWQL